LGDKRWNMEKNSKVEKVQEGKEGVGAKRVPTHWDLGLGVERLIKKKNC